MEDLFLTVVNMSLTGSLVILLVLLGRLLLQKSPKIFSYALWSVVLFRLLCPVSLPSPVSLLAPLKPATATSQGPATYMEYVVTQALEVPETVPGAPTGVSPEKAPSQAATPKASEKIHPLRRENRRLGMACGGGDHGPGGNRQLPPFPAEADGRCAKNQKRVSGGSSGLCICGRADFPKNLPAL